MNKELTPAQRVAATVADIKNVDPGLGGYSFSNLSEIIRFAEVMSKSGAMIPTHLQGDPAICTAVTMRALHWGFDPFALANETYIAKQGQPIAYQGKVFSGVLNNAGIRLQYRYEGEFKVQNTAAKSAKGNETSRRSASGTRCCVATWSDPHGNIYEYKTPTLDEITIKNSPLWHNDPDQQLAYYAARGWARRHRSELIMGAYSDDETRAMEPRIKDVTPKPSGFARLAQQAREGTTEGREPETVEQAPVEETAQEAAQHWTEAVDTSDFFPGQEAFTEGVEAFQSNAPRTDCPYKGQEDAIHWLGGWDEAERAADDG